MPDNTKLADRLVKVILKDLKNRGGLGDAWDACDSGIQKETCEKWRRLILAELTVAGMGGGE